MKLLVVHATKSGSTAEVAAWVADAAHDAGHEVMHAALGQSPDPAEHDAVIVGSGIRAGKWHADAVDWLTQHKETLATRPLALFTSSLRAADPSPEVQAEVLGYTTSMIEPVGLQPVSIGRLVGAYDPAKVSWWERQFMKALHQGPADDRNEKAVKQWAAEALVALEQARTTA